MNQPLPLLSSPNFSALPYHCPIDITAGIPLVYKSAGFLPSINAQRRFLQKQEAQYTSQYDCSGGICLDYRAQSVS